jgi:hypothetical protein
VSAGLGGSGFDLAGNRDIAQAKTISWCASVALAGLAPWSDEAG